MQGELTSWDGYLLPPRRQLAAAGCIALVAVTIAVVACEAPQPILYLSPLLVVVLVSGILFRWPYGAMFLLFAAVAAPRAGMKIFELNVKPEHAIAGLIVICIAFFRRPQPQRWRIPDYALLVFLAATYVSSTFFSENVAITLKDAILFTGAVLPYWIVRACVRDAETFPRVMRLFLIGGCIEAAYGIGCFVSNALFDTKVGVTFFSGFIPGVHGSQWEPNIFGSYISAFTAAFLFLYLQKTRGRGWYLAGLLLTGVGSLVSLARASWIGLLLAAGLATLLNTRKQGSARRILVPAAITACVAGLMLTLAFQIEPIRERMGTLSPELVSDDPTVVHRLVYIGYALENIQRRPWMGGGYNSFGLTQDWETEEGEEPAWLGNLVIRLLHDVGIVGLLIFTTFVGSLAWSARCFLDPRVPLQIRRLGIALSLGAVVFVVAFQATEASMLAFTWAHLGLLRAGISVASESALPAAATA